MSKRNKFVFPIFILMFQFSACSSLQFKADKKCVHCDIKVLTELSSKKKIDKKSIERLFCVIDTACNNNAEFLEFSNEVLFLSISSCPKNFIKLFNDESEYKKLIILEMLANPTTDKWDVQKIISKIEDLGLYHSDRIIDALKN